VVSWNAGAERVYGYSNAEATGCDLFALLCTEFLTNDEVGVPREEVLRLAAEGGWQGESRERRSDGASIITMASLTGRLDRDGRMELSLVNRDITAQRREEHEALHDALTGLPNRRMLTLRLYDAYARACRHSRPLAVLFIDLDGFKPINDTYGHAAGDEVLKAVAVRLTGAVRGTDTVARIGGDEFVVVLQETGTRASVTEVTRRILDSVAEPVEVGTTSVQVLASIGIAHVMEPNVDIAADELLDAADLAMYEAKRQRLGMAFAEE
jgi:diguanylate cyclase (GGDEF)-like protein/PAS domain S-box-containing protein